LEKPLQKTTENMTIQRYTAPLHDVLQAFLGVLAPRTCFICGIHLEIIHETGLLNTYICQRCYDALSAAPRADELLGRLTQMFTGEDLALERVVARFSLAMPFDEQARERENVALQPAMDNLIYPLKYHASPNLGIALGEELGLLAQTLSIKNNDEPYDAIVPVPLHPARERERGYNQAERIAVGVARVLNVPVQSAWLRRSSYTVSQTQLSADERQRNVRGVFVESQRFGVVQHAVQGARILVVDDVITTGATMNSCALLLRQCGAARVDAAAVAAA
jgi:ComF family protein